MSMSCSTIRINSRGVRATYSHTLIRCDLDPLFVLIKHPEPLDPSFPQVIAEANAGYANSGINVRLRAFCIEKLNFNENQFNNPDRMLGAFSTAKGTILHS